MSQSHILRTADLGTVSQSHILRLSIQSQYVLDLVDGKKLKRAAARLFSEMFHTNNYAHRAGERVKPRQGQ